MRRLRLAFFLAGCGLLAVVLRSADLAAGAQHAAALGVSGLGIVFAIRMLAFSTDVWAWQLTFESLPVSPRWLGRLFLIRMVGEAAGQLSLFAGLGGEPLKALLLKHRYQIGYRESGASLVLAKTLDLLALVAFLAVGVALVMASPRLSERFKATAGVGFVLFALAIAGFFLAQRLRLVSRLGRRLAGSRLGNRLARVLRGAADTDEMVATFYTRRRRRFRAALGAGALNWPLGVIEIYCVMALLAAPVTFADAWIIDAMAQLAIAGTFFIPLGIGVQEGTFVVVCGAITGNPALGLSVAIVRRVRELVWLVVGVIIWWVLTVPTWPAPDSDEPPCATPSAAGLPAA